MPKYRVFLFLVQLTGYTFNYFLCFRRFYPDNNCLADASDNLSVKKQTLATDEQTIRRLCGCGCMWWCLPRMFTIFNSYWTEFFINYFQLCLSPPQILKNTEWMTVAMLVTYIDRWMMTTNYNEPMIVL